MKPHMGVPRKVELDQACVIREGDQEYCIYPMGDLMAVLGKRWSLFIIAVLGNERRMRFNDLVRQLKGISPRTLTDGLRELESLGLVERTLFPEVPPRVEYTITSEGRDLPSHPNPGPPMGDRLRDPRLPAEPRLTTH